METKKKGGGKAKERPNIASNYSLLEEGKEGAS
jgi:hypothetical protein